MKRIILITILLLASAAAAAAQTAARYVLTVNGAPVGNCTISGSGYAQVYVNRANGDWYVCSGSLGTTTGTWVLAGNHSAGTGTVTTVSVVTANGFSGSVANATTTPAITLNNPTVLTVTGTGGAGFLQLANQALAPSTPTSSGRFYFDSSNRFSWIGTNGFTRTFDGTANTANRVYTLPDGDSKFPIASQFLTFNGPTAARTFTFPDANATIARTDAGQTFTGTNVFGVITATTLNGNTFTTGTYTLTGVAGKTFTFNKTLTLEGTDGTTMTFPGTSATLARTDAGNTFTGHQTLEGVTSTGATGSGKFVFDTSPTLVTPNIGAATGASMSATGILSAAGTGSHGASKFQFSWNSGAGIATAYGANNSTPGAQCFSGLSADASVGDNFVLFSKVGNVKIGSSCGDVLRSGTEGTNQVVLFNGTAPVGTLANGASFYAASGEMRVMDAAGNSTLLSPHDHQTNEWIFYSCNTVTGKCLRIEMERMMRALDKKLGGGFIHEYMSEAEARPDLRAGQQTKRVVASRRSRKR